MIVCKRVVVEARNIASGLYRMNARGADRYGFTLNTARDEIVYGEFLWPSDVEDDIDYVIELDTMKIRKSKPSK